MKRFLLALALGIMLSSSAAYAQNISSSLEPRTTPAYSTLIQRRVKVQAQLESLLEEYSSEWPQAKTFQFELDALKIEMKKMLEVPEEKVSNLTSGYGTLILRRVSLDAEIQSLLLEYSPNYPGLKEKQRELELLDQETRKIMK
jgi:uncharacterized protein involved in exopolysaccharide biosynthesis